MKRRGRNKSPKEKKSRSKSPNQLKEKRRETQSQNTRLKQDALSEPFTKSDSGSMDIPKPLAIFLDELEAHLKEKPLMMCAAVFAWSFAMARNFGYKLV